MQVIDKRGNIKNHPKDFSRYTYDHLLVFFINYNSKSSFQGTIIIHNDTNYLLKFVREIAKEKSAPYYFFYLMYENYIITNIRTIFKMNETDIQNIHSIIDLIIKRYHSKFNPFCNNNFFNLTQQYFLINMKFISSTKIKRSNYHELIYFSRMIEICDIKNTWKNKMMSVVLCYSDSPKKKFIVYRT